jgi:hypothetical protein
MWFICIFSFMHVPINVQSERRERRRRFKGEKKELTTTSGWKRRWPLYANP